MISVAICDDDIATTGKIENMLRSIAKRKFIQIETEVFWDGKQLEKAVIEKAYFGIDRNSPFNIHSIFIFYLF